MILLLSFTGYSQTSKLTNPTVWEVGGYIGGANYQGDLVVPALFTLEETNLALGLIARRYFNESWALRGNLIFSGLSGDDYNFSDREDWSPDVALKFTSPLIELTVYGEWYPLGKRIESHKISHNVDYFKRLQPYLFLGVGGVYTDPEVTSNNNDGPLPASVPFEDTKLHLSIPIGGGLKWDLNANWIISLEGGFRYPISDALEGVSEGRDPDDNDWYAVGGVGLSYRFDKRTSRDEQVKVIEEKNNDDLKINENRETLDTDGDGIVDAMDKCPAIAGTKANGGCPEISAEDREILRFAMSNVQFETGSANLTSASLSVLDQVYGVLDKYPYYKLRISGHTDNTGRQDSNLKLSKERAQSCYTYLSGKGISSSRMMHQGFGDRNPIADNETAEGRKTNRRVEFDLYVD